MGGFKRLLFWIGIFIIFSVGYLSKPVNASSLQEPRLAGPNRYETAVAIAQDGWKQADYAVLAFGENFPDALAAAPLAKQLDAPILLTSKDQLSPESKKELIELKVKHVFIVGGTGVISSVVEAELQNMGLKVQRLAGNDRYETAVKIAEQLGDITHIVVTTGDDFPDALSMGSIAAIKHMPILLMPKDQIPQSVADFLAGKSIQKSFVIGDANCISDAIAQQLPGVERITGLTQYDRNAAIVNRFSADLSINQIALATGNGFADALTGTAYAAKFGLPVILTENSSNAAQELVKGRAASLTHVIIFGGTGVLPDDLVNYYVSGNSDGTGQGSDYSNMIPTSQPPVFKGYFKNTDYSHPQYFLYAGEQTKASAEIKSIASQFNNNRDISTLSEIMIWLKKNLNYADGAKFDLTASDIISSRNFTGCTDMGLAFASLSRAKGIPTVFVQTGRIDWIEKWVTNAPDKSKITGHILVEVLLSDNQWYLVDSTAGLLYYNYDKENFSLPDGYYVFAKSTEVWDTGVKDSKDNTRVMYAAFTKFDIKKYVNPKYDYLDLSSNIKYKGRDFNGTSLVIGNGAVILGAKETCEAFQNKFFSQTNTLRGSETSIEESNLMTAPLLVDLHVKGTGFPDYLVNYLPDLNANSENGKIFRYTKDGQDRILIIGDSTNALLDIISNLSEDFLLGR